jgi:hypothetical protein
MCRDRTGHFCTVDILAHVWLRCYKYGVFGTATYCRLDRLQVELLSGKRFYFLQTGVTVTVLSRYTPLWRGQGRMYLFKTLDMNSWYVCQCTVYLYDSHCVLNFPKSKPISKLSPYIFRIFT